MADQFLPGETAGIPNSSPVSNPLGMLTQLMLGQAQKRMESAPKPEERQAALQQVMESYRTPIDDRPGYQRLAEGYLASGNIANPVLSASSAFQYKLKTDAAIREAARKGAIAAAEAQYEDIKNREQNLVPGLGTGAMTALVTDSLNPRLTNVAGVGLVDQRSRQVVVPASEMGNYTKLYNDFYKTAVDQKMPNPEQWAEQQAASRIRNALGSTTIAGGRAEPLGSGVPAPQGGLPTPAAQQDMSPVVDLAPGTEPDTLAMLKREEAKAVAQQDYARADEVRKARVAIEAKVAKPAAKPTQPEALKYRDTAKAKMEEETAGATGKALGATYEDLQTASSASSDMKIQLNALKDLFTTPNLPEGALAERIQGIRSGLASLGVDVGPEVGAGDMINAISGKMALLTRTADGKNLMPGAMSDFEQKILRGLAPGLQQTAEGRVALVEFLSDMADVRIRLAEEARKLADANRGILPADWYARRDRVLKEEQARLALKSRELANRFKGAK